MDEGKHINLTLDVKDVEAYRGKCIDIIEIKDGNNSKSPLLGKCTFHMIFLDILCVRGKVLRSYFHPVLGENTKNALNSPK